MEPAPAGSLLDYLSQVPDPRRRKGRRHSVVAMLASVVCALLTGAKGVSAIVEWLHRQEVDVWHGLGFTRRPPKDHAFRDLLAKIPPEELESLIAAWIADQFPDTQSEASQVLEAIAIDGKKLRGSLASHGGMVHLVALFQQRTGVTLAQGDVDPTTNEHKAALSLIRSIVLKGRVITGDAMFCQRDLCQEIIDHGGHYLFVVKDNQPALREAIAAEFTAAFSPLRRATTSRNDRRGRDAGQGTRSRREAASSGQHATGR